MTDVDRWRAFCARLDMEIQTIRRTEGIDSSAGDEWRTFDSPTFTLEPEPTYVFPPRVVVTCADCREAWEPGHRCALIRIGPDLYRPIERACQQCGRSFAVPMADRGRQRDERRFCSAVCVARWTRARRGVMSGKHKPLPLVAHCRRCGMPREKGTKCTVCPGYGERWRRFQADVSKEAGGVR